jgi:hypothetical protein
MTEEIKNQILIGLKAQEDSPQAKLIIGGTFALQDYFFANAGRYIGNDVLHMPGMEVWYEDFRGLEVGVDSYVTPDGEHGFNLRLKYTHADSGYQFMKIIPGRGTQPEEQDWILIEEA